MDKSAFDLEGPSSSEWTDESKADVTDKIKSTCQQKFGHVFIVKLVDKQEGSSSSENFNCYVVLFVTTKNHP